MTALLLFATLQATNWVAMPERVTVGDTVRISRSVPAEPGVRVRVPALEASDLLQPLSAPRWSYADGTVLISYELSLFRVGVHDVTLPELELVYPAGRTATVPPSTVTLDVRSVLPESTSAPAPKPSLAPVSRSPRRLFPVVALPVATLLLVGAVALRRRRRRARPVPPTVVAEAVHPPLDAWIAAGESRAVASLVARRLRAALADAAAEGEEERGAAAHVDAGPEHTRDPVAAEVVAVMRALERARFSPAAPADVHEVVDEAERAIRALRAARVETE